MSDFLDYAVMNPSDALKQHLAVANGGQPIYGYLDLLKRQIIYMKGNSGYPTEVNTWDDTYVYQSTTEVSWNPATPSFKIFASKSWPGNNGGIVWSPRTLPVNGDCSPVETADSSYRTYTDCSHYTTQTLGGPIMTSVSSPFELDLGGDLAVQEVIQQTYLWGPGFKTMEQNLYAKGFGWVRWRTSNLVNGVYQKQQESLFNTIVKGGLPTPQFPCGIPVIS